MATGHLRRRESKDGAVSYQIVVESERDPVSGKRERRYKTVKGTKKEAELVKRKLINEVESGGVVTQSAIKLGDWLDEWLKLYLPNIEATTRTGYRDKIDNMIKPYLGKIQLKALKTENIQSWINELNGKGLAPKSIRNAFNNLNAALKKAVVLRKLSHNPCEGAVLPKLKRYQAKVYNATQVNNLLNLASDTDFYLALVIILTTGLRRGEIAALKWKHIDLTNKVIHIRENMVKAGVQILEKSPKSESGIRDIPIGDDVAELLFEAQKQYFIDREDPCFRDLGYVIHKKDGTPYRPDALTRKWARFLEANNLPKIRLHDLRHTHATLLIQAGVNPKVVQERLGHADVTITLNTYTHVMPDMAKDAANKIENIINF
ncbi:MAG: site-specific integrase [Clostridia bacterium]|nr:site-specific integrase [Clostridia bacterium]